MDKEHLDQLDSVPHVVGTNQEHCQCSRCSGGGQDQVNAREHGQEYVQMLVQGWVSPDDQQDGDIAPEGKKVKDTQRQCYPVLAFL